MSILFKSLHFYNKYRNQVKTITTQTGEGEHQTERFCCKWHGKSFYISG